MIDKTTKTYKLKRTLEIAFCLAAVFCGVGLIFFAYLQIDNIGKDRYKRYSAKTLERTYVVTYNNRDVDTLKVVSYDVILDKGDFIGRTVTTNTTYASNVRTYKLITTNNK
ncbi:hypothetical protein MA9V2_031 [Chryseobacterium phage MA9V-2]|nr:hypothetical protein MA9V2_031 [Chryseobacterium phage MA9V-2]